VDTTPRGLQTDVTIFDRDLTEIKLPGGRELLFSYDRKGKLISRSLLLLLKEE
jgi:YD repeat-containing protein